MIPVKITRGPSTDAGTFGVLEMDGFSCYTLELHEENNKRMESRIPAGTYTAKVRFSAALGTVYELEKVPGRDSILIHSANWAGDEDKGLYSELRGCIALGVGKTELLTPKGNLQPALTGSKAAIRAFMKLTGGAPIELTIC